MLLYELTFPRRGVCGETGLYFRGGSLREDGLHVPAGEEVSFDTYFNCFSHIKYSEYTDNETVTLKLKLEGKGSVFLGRFFDGRREILQEIPYSGDVEAGLNINSLQKKGFIYFSVRAERDTVLTSGGWHGDAAPSDVRIGVVICTFRREEYLRANISEMQKFRKTGRDFFDVFIVDNGRTVSDDFGDGFTVIPNANTGGSGGFTRGIREVMSGDFTHFLLMDDDIVFDCAVLERTRALLSCLKEEYRGASVGGGMLELDKPYLQKELGANWTGSRLEPKREKLDARLADTICGNEEDAEPEYNAWWYMCMPVDTADKYGYPLPMFIRCDDVEYGLRAAEHVIVTSGIAVWHESFDVKYSPEMEYYIKRNELIVNALYPKRKGVLSNFRKLVNSVGKQLVFQRYYAVDLLFRAYDDFLKGPDFFLTLDGEKNHIEIRRSCPSFYTPDELKERFGITVDHEEISASLLQKPRFLPQLFTLNGYLLPVGSYVKGVAQVDSVLCKPINFYRRARVLHFSSAQNRGFVTEIRKSALFRSGFKLIAMFFKLLFRYRRTASEFSKIQGFSQSAR